MSTALGLQSKETQSAGNALERYSAYAESTSAKVADLKNAQEQLFMKLVNSKMINSVVSELTSFVKEIDFLVTQTPKATLALVGMSTALILIMKNFKAVTLELIASGGQISAIDVLLKALFGSMASGAGIIATLKGAFLALKASMVALFTTPAGLIFLGLATAVGVATYAITKHIQHQKELKQQIDDNTESYKNLTQAIKDNNIEEMKNSSSSLENQQKNLQNLLKQREELQSQLSNTNPDEVEVDPTGLTTTTTSKYGELQSKLADVNNKIQEQSKVLRDAGVAFDDTTGKIDTLALAESRIATNELIDKIIKERDANIDHDNAIINLINEYRELSNVENANATQKQRMAQIAQQLSGEINGLVLVKDAEGNVTIQNTNLLGKEIDMRNADISNLKTSANVQLEAAKNSAQAQVGQTKVTYQEILKRISFYQQEMKALGSLKTSTGQTIDELEAKWKAGTITPQENAMYNDLQRWANSEGVRASGNLSALLDAKAEIEAIFSRSSGANFGSGGNISSGSSYIPPNSDSSKKAEDEAKKAEQARDEAYQAIEDINKKLEDSIKQQVEQEKKALEERLDNYKKFIDDKLKALDDEYTQEDRQRKLAEENKKKAELQAQQQELLLDNSDEAKNMRYDLQQKIDAQQQAIDDLNRDYSREDRKANLQKQLTDYEKQIQDAQKALEDKYTDAEISKLANNGLKTGLVTIGDTTMSVKQLLLDAMEKSGEAFEATGKKLQNELIDKLIKVQQLLASMDGNGNISGSTALNIMGSYADGGLSTSTGLNILHGTDSIPEIIFNGNQYRQLAENIWKLATRPVELPRINDSLLSSNNSGGVYLNFDNLIGTIQGNMDDSTLIKVKDFVKTEIPKIVADAQANNDKKLGSYRPRLV